MKTFILISLFSAVVWAGDTIPLKNPTTPTNSGQTTESFKSSTNAATSSTVVPEEEAGPAHFTKDGKPPKPYIASLDTYGSARINEKSVRKALGPELDKWLKKGLESDPQAVVFENKLKEKVKKTFGFPYAEWSVVQYFQPGDFAIHVTLDVVEPADVKTRMPFYPDPTAELTDPDGLIKSWKEYEDTALDLIEKGQLEPDTNKCPALHCPFGHKHVKLKKYEKMFVEGVKKNERALVEIETKDKRGEFRAAACYLLAYLTDGNRVVSYEVSRIKDPDDLVRNNALRVLGDIAEFHPEYVIPVGTVTQALHFPRVSDRSKALYVAFQLVGNSKEAKEDIIQTAVPELIQMLSSKQPDHRDLSYGILRKVSGKDLAINDVRGWNNWYSKLPDRNLTKK